MTFRRTRVVEGKAGQHDQDDVDPHSMVEEIVKQKRASSSKEDQDEEDNPYDMEEDVVEEIRMESVGIEEKKEDDDPYEMGNDAVHEPSSESKTKEEENTPQPPSITDHNPDFKAFFHDPSLMHRDIRSSTVDFTRQPKHPPSHNHPNVGCAETNGERQTMEDAVLLLPELRFSRIGLQEMSNIEFELEHAMHPQSPNDDVNGCGLFGVFDRHKGPQTATFLAAHFVAIFLETVREMLGIDKQTTNVSPSSSPHPLFIPTLLRATMENLTKKMRLLRVDDRACALLALITPMTAFVTNVGDCRAVLPVFLDVRHTQPQTTHNTNILVRPWRFRDVVSLFTDPQLTIDHKPVCQSVRINGVLAVAPLERADRTRQGRTATAKRRTSTHPGFEGGRTRLISGLAELHDRHPPDLVCGWTAGTVSDSVIQHAGLIIEADDDNAYTAFDEDSGSMRVDKGKFAKFAALRNRVQLDENYGDCLEAKQMLLDPNTGVVERTIMKKAAFLLQGILEGPERSSFYYVSAQSPVVNGLRRQLLSRQSVLKMFEDYDSSIIRVGIDVIKGVFSGLWASAKTATNLAKDAVQTTVKTVSSALGEDEEEELSQKNLRKKDQEMKKQTKAKYLTPTLVDEGLRHILLHLLIVTLMVSIGMMDIFSHLLTIILCGSVLLSHRLAPQRKNSGVLPLPPSHRTHSYISLPTPSSIRKDPHILLPLKLHPRQFYHQSFFQHSDERFRRRCSLQNATSDGQAIKTTMHFGKQGSIPFLSS
ncbi:hypothetical protein BLNAU_19024 [Blattamonas nauphoetae]|uniref:PPM-type phosphatase domain-containing protein n=1 Tax=Blattamonas nauphoetae TaxID=2049346 RepID=A0ABQ9X2Y1_9EUKA|nr:hypothetical protein BLNAU_19024 [Blattamonas nauphoetae]